MASVSVGRIVFTRRALPAVELVNFALDHGDIIIRTESGGKLAAATQHSVVAFEVDALDAAQQAGWSVTAVGQSREVTDPAELGRLREMSLSSWAAGAHEHFIRISPEILNGRRLTASGPQTPGSQTPTGAQNAAEPAGAAQPADAAQPRPQTPPSPLIAYGEG